jgi:hypothetical protein
MTPNPLKGYLGIQQKFDRKLFSLLEKVAVSLTTRIAGLAQSGKFSDSVRAAQLRSALVEIRREQIKMFQGVGDVVRAGQLAASIKAIDQLGDVMGVITSSMTKAAAEEMIQSVLATSRAGIKNLYARTPRELSTRLYDNAALTSGKIEDIIRAGIGSGLSARELAKDVRQFVSPTAPGGVSYVSSRLARTEINNAFHNQQIAGMNAPGVKGAKWNLSGSHPKPDECNRLAQSDQYKMGIGVFPSGKVPGKPHPQCLCYLTYVTMEPDEFVKELQKGTFDDDLRKRFKANLEIIKGGAVPVPVKKTVVKKATPVKKPTTTRKTAPTKATRPRPKPQPVPMGAQPYHTSLEGIEDLANTVENSTIKSVRALTGGVSADTELIEFANGMKVVRKSAGNPGAEHAASVIGRAIGVRTPRVYRNHPGQVHMDYLSDAKTAVELDVTSQRESVEAHRAWRERRNEIVASDDGKLMGLFDVLIRNRDRSIGNWMVSNDNRLFAIDHGHSGPLMMGSRVAPSPLAGGPFAESLFTQGWKGHPFSAADLAEVRGRVEAVGDELIHAGQRNVLDYALGVLDKMSGTAKSTRNLIAGRS